MVKKCNTCKKEQPDDQFYHYSWPKGYKSCNSCREKDRKKYKLKKERYECPHSWSKYRCTEGCRPPWLGDMKIYYKRKTED